MSFRDMDQKMVEIHGVKMVKLLEKMGLKLDNPIWCINVWLYRS